MDIISPRLDCFNASSTFHSSSSSPFILKTSLSSSSLLKLGLDIWLKLSSTTNHVHYSKPITASNWVNPWPAPHILQVFLLLPLLYFTPTTSNFVKADTQSSTLLHWRSLNHLNLPSHTISTTQGILKRLHRSTQHFLSFNDISHIRHTIICSIQSKLLRFSAFIAKVSAPYVKTFWAQAPVYLVIMLKKINKKFCFGFILNHFKFKIFIKQFYTVIPISFIIIECSKITSGYSRLRRSLKTNQISIIIRSRCVKRVDESLPWLWNAGHQWTFHWCYPWMISIPTPLAARQSSTLQENCHFEHYSDKNKKQYDKS